MSGLPEGWEEATFDDAISSVKNGRNVRQDKSGSGLAVSRIETIADGQVNFARVGYTLDAFDADRDLLKDGDLLFSHINSASHLGKTAIFRELGRSLFHGINLLRIQPEREAVYPEFFHLQCKLMRQDGVFELNGQHAVNQSSINQKTLKALPFLIPPLAEQKRIVAKLDRLSAQSGKAKTHLAEVQTLATRAKQATLAAAFRGELTAEWRAKYGNVCSLEKSLQPANDVEEGEWSSPEIPAGWNWEPFKKTFSDHTHSKKKLAQKLYQEEGRFPVVDQGAELIGGYSDDEALLQTTELPVVVFGDHTRCAKFIDFEFVQGADGVKVLKANSAIDSRYAYWLIEAIELPDKGYSRHMKFLKASSFPIAPPEEQTEIVRRIETAFAKIDRMVEEASRAADLLDRLEQQLLSKAFRGELVPQDPNDEPASALLARIREARANAPKPKRRRKTAKA